jgi:hypothetical protein
LTLLIYCILILVWFYLYPYTSRKYKLLYQGAFTVVEYITFALVFLFSIEKKEFKQLIIGLSIGFITFQVLFTFNSGHSHLDSVPIGIETILIFVYSFYFLYQEFKKESQLLLKNSMFWIAIGIVFYLAGSFFFNILANHMTYLELDQYWFYSYIFDIIKNILITMGLLMYKQKQPVVSPYLDMDINQTA